MQSQKLPQAVLANTGFSASRIGLGCMGISAFYTTTGLPSDDEAIELIGKALDQGVNFFDTAFVYGQNEELLAKAIKKYGRERFFLATKVPPITIDENQKFVPVEGTVENIKKFCDLSLKRLEIDYIDLYYQHRVDPNIPIETQAEGFKQLIQEGKIKYYGLSEASEDTIRRAHKVHPLTAVQEEYSLFTRDVENNGVLKATQELGIALVAYSPLGRGVLTGNLGKLDDKDWRNGQPRFSEDNMKKNQALVDKMKDIAKSLNITPGQLALAWVLSKGENIFPIPGTKREKYLTENNSSANIKLSADVIKQLEDLFPPNVTSGLRYEEQFYARCTTSTPQI